MSLLLLFAGASSASASEGTLSETLDGATLSATASLTIQGAAAVTLDGATVEATGTNPNGGEAVTHLHGRRPRRGRDFDRLERERLEEIAAREAAEDREALERELAEAERRAVVVDERLRLMVATDDAARELRRRLDAEIARAEAIRAALEAQDRDDEEFLLLVA